MTAATVATGWEAHVDTAAVRSQAAWRAGLGFRWAPQIIQLRRGDRGGDGGLDILGTTEASPRRCNILSLSNQNAALSFFLKKTIFFFHTSYNLTLQHLKA